MLNLVSRLPVRYSADARHSDLLNFTVPDGVAYCAEGGLAPL